MYQVIPLAKHWGGGWDTARSVLSYLTREWEVVMTSVSFSQQQRSTPNCLCDSWVSELCHLQVWSGHKQLEDGVSDFTVCSVILVAWWHIWHQQVIPLFILAGPGYAGDYDMRDVQAVSQTSTVNVYGEKKQRCSRVWNGTCKLSMSWPQTGAFIRHVRRAVDLCMQTVDLCRETQVFQKEWWMIWQSWGCVVTEARAGVCSKIFNKVNKAIAVHDRVDLNEVLHFRENKQI